MKANVTIMVILFTVNMRQLTLLRRWCPKSRDQAIVSYPSRTGYLPNSMISLV